MAMISHDEVMSRVCFVDNEGNVFTLPATTDLEAALVSGDAPEGLELLFAAGGVNPRYAHILTAALMLYQMAQQSKIIFEGHSEQLQQVGTRGTMDLGIAFEGMAATLNLAQRNAIEGVSAVIAQTEKYRK